MLAEFFLPYPSPLSEGETLGEQKIYFRLSKNILHDVPRKNLKEAQFYCQLQFAIY